ncbi:MAG: hypothetical protein JNK26_05110 [Candidatus Doudnabacteria bacterium]|nr:hypothetical protein [Candidatus Doudnabacteria bacterium]
MQRHLIEQTNLYTRRNSDLLRELFVRYPNVAIMLLPVIFLTFLTPTNIANAQDFDFVPSEDQLPLAQSLLAELGGPELTLTEQQVFFHGLFRASDEAFRKYFELRAICAGLGQDAVIFPFVQFGDSHDPDNPNKLTAIIPYAAACGFLSVPEEAGTNLNSSTLPAQLTMMNNVDPGSSSIAQRFPYGMFSLGDLKDGTSSIRTAAFALKDALVHAGFTGNFESLMSSEDFSALVEWLIDNLCTLIRVDERVPDPSRVQEYAEIRTPDGSTIGLTMCRISGGSGEHLDPAVINRNGGTNPILERLTTEGDTQYLTVTRGGESVKLTISSPDETSFIVVEVRAPEGSSDALLVVIVLLPLVLMFAGFVGFNLYGGRKREVFSRNVGMFIIYVCAPILNNELSSYSLEELKNILNTMQQLSRFFAGIEFEKLQREIDSSGGLSHVKPEDVKNIYTTMLRGAVPAKLAKAIQRIIRDSEEPGNVSIKLIAEYPVLSSVLQEFINQKGHSESEPVVTATPVEPFKGKGARRQRLENGSRQTRPFSAVEPERIDYELITAKAVTLLQNLTDGKKGLDNMEVEQLHDYLEKIYTYTSARSEFEAAIFHANEERRVIVIAGDRLDPRELTVARFNSCLLRLKEYVAVLAGKPVFGAEIASSPIEEFAPSAYEHLETTLATNDPASKLSTSFKVDIAVRYRVHFAKQTLSNGRTRVFAIFTQHENR